MESSEPLISFEQFLGVLSSNPFLIIVMVLVMGTIFVNGATDAANAIATLTAGSVDSFVERMNQKAQELGAKVITMSDSNGCIFDPEGIRLDVVKDIKLRHRGRIREYAQLVPGSEFRSDFRDLWSVPCDVALPCATQNEIDAETARRIVRGGAMALAEGANMPSTPAAIEVLREGGVLFAPAKAANAGGVAVSGLEMCQNSMRLAWTFDEVAQRLHQIMLDIFHNIYDASVEYGVPGNLLDGANIAGFRKVADAMLAQGVC